MTREDILKLPLHRLWDIVESAYKFAEAETSDLSTALQQYREFKNVVLKGEMDEHTKSE